MGMARRSQKRPVTEEDNSNLSCGHDATFDWSANMPKPPATSLEEICPPIPPHCPLELVKALRMKGIHVRLPGPLQERLQNDLMMESWLGKKPEKK